jgi:hypothetical protein
VCNAAQNVSHPERIVLGLLRLLRREGTIADIGRSLERYPRGEEIQECFNSTMRGFTMPAFTFEKISSRVRRVSPAAAAKKQRGVIVQILDRFSEARLRRKLHADKGAEQPKSPAPK